MSYGALNYSNPSLINFDNSHWSAGFTNKIIPTNGLPEPTNNIQALNSSKILGGKKNNIIYKRQMNKKMSINKKNSKKNLRYKKNNKKYSKKHKKYIFIKKHFKNQSRKQSRKQTRKQIRGGWGQFQNNTPITPSYSVAGLQPSNFLSSTANPPPINLTNNCVDNYNHYTNQGFPSKNF